MKRRIWLILPLLVFFASPTVGQQSDARSAIAVAAASALRADASLPRGPTRVLPAKDMEQAVSAVARALRGDVTTLEAARPCGKLPSSCRLVNATVLISVGKPTISGESAQLLAQVYWQTDSARQPVATKFVEVTLKRINGQWTVTDQEVLMIT